MTCGAATGLRRKGQFSVMHGSHAAGPEDEVDAAYDWLRATQPGVGAAFVAEGQRAAEDAAEWPGIASRVVIPGTSKGVRCAGWRRFS